MPDQRKAYRHGNSLVVALSTKVQGHLGVRPGAEVYWHLVRGKEVVLAVTAERKGGHPEGLSLRKRVEELERECDRLRRQVQARPEKAVNVGIAHGWAQAMRQNTETFDLVKWMEGRFDDLAARIPFRRRPGRPARSAATVPSPEVETIPAPVLEAPRQG
jgi:antitoxin component of MazEF toxin-antitoxin module